MLSSLSQQGADWLTEAAGVQYEEEAQPEDFFV